MHTSYSILLSTINKLFFFNVQFYSCHTPIQTHLLIRPLQRRAGRRTPILSVQQLTGAREAQHFPRHERRATLTQLHFAKLPRFHLMAMPTLLLPLVLSFKVSRYLLYFYINFLFCLLSYSQHTQRHTYSLSPCTHRHMHTHTSNEQPAL